MKKNKDEYLKKETMRKVAKAIDSNFRRVDKDLSEVEQGEKLLWNGMDVVAEWIDEKDEEINKLRLVANWGLAIAITTGIVLAFALIF